MNGQPSADRPVSPDAARARLGELMDRANSARIDAALERSRESIDTLAAVAARLGTSLPDQVAEAVRVGVRDEVGPAARQLAEIRGLLNGVTRRLDELESSIAADRHARLDDLALLVELVSTGWRNVDERLAKVEGVSKGLSR